MCVRFLPVRHLLLNMECVMSLTHMFVVRCILSTSHRQCSDGNLKIVPGFFFGTAGSQTGAGEGWAPARSVVAFACHTLAAGKARTDRAESALYVSMRQTPFHGRSARNLRTRPIAQVRYPQARRHATSAADTGYCGNTAQGKACTAPRLQVACTTPQQDAFRSALRVRHGVVVGHGVTHDC